MTVIDLTHTITSTMPIYPGKCCFSPTLIEIEELDIRVLDVALSTGIGTHMDAPFHFDSKGKRIHEIPISLCSSKANVFHFSDFVQENIDAEITDEMILMWEKKHGKIEPNQIVLIHTGWDRFWETEHYFQEDEKGVHHPGLSEKGAQLLMSRKVLGIGIDTFGLDVGIQGSFPAHRAVLYKGSFIVENLNNLSKLPPKGAHVWVLPMKIKDAPEAPVRAYASF